MQLPPIPEEPLRFASKSELAIGVLLEQFIPDFHLREGKTFQVPIGYNKTCDFLIHGVFFEYHPPVLKYDMQSEKAFFRIAKLLNKLPTKAADELREAMLEELGAAYYKKRRFVITASFGKNTELVVCQSADDVYRDIIQRFAPNPPGLKVFQELFRCALKAEQLKNPSKDRKRSNRPHSLPG